MQFETLASLRHKMKVTKQTLCELPSSIQRGKIKINYVFIIPDDDGQDNKPYWKMRLTEGEHYQDFIFMEKELMEMKDTLNEFANGEKTLEEITTKHYGVCIF